MPAGTGIGSFILGCGFSVYGMPMGLKVLYCTVFTETSGSWENDAGCSKV